MKISHEQLKVAANVVRGLSMDMIEKANSGHPGAPMGMADLAVSLWLRHLNVDPKDAAWANRDRLVFSGGHASALVYSLFHLAGVGDLTLDELKTFRQLGSRTAGHPERGLMPGVEVTTGPLGQGLAMGVGMAIAERMSAAKYGEIVDHRTWVFCGDGDLEEGISHEACSLAGCLKLDKLCVVYDSNRITIEGPTGLAMADDAKKRFESYGWKVLEVDGHDFDQIERAYRKAEKTAGQPVFVLAHTHIGFGAPKKQDSADSHGAPLGAEEVAGAKRNLGLDPEKFFDVPREVYDLFACRAAQVHRLANRWKKDFKAWRTASPELAAAWDAAHRNAVPADAEAKLPRFDPAKSVATRGACGETLNALAPVVPSLVGGSADLGPSNKTVLKGLGDVAAGAFGGRNLHFGVRELAMTAVVNGITAHGGWRGYGATFFVFSDYCRPAIRLAALMKLPSLFFFSHDSFYVGEDGPTHEPVEHLAALRSMPNVLTLRPADANETAAAILVALRHLDGPTCIMTSRQNLPVLPEARREDVAKGAYVLFDSSERATGIKNGFPELAFIASGSEVAVALEAARTLADEGKAVRVVSMPSWELFQKQSTLYRASVLPKSCSKRVIVEAGSRFGWDRYAEDPAHTRYVTMDGFGASGPYKVLAGHFGFTAGHVLEVARELV